MEFRVAIIDPFLQNPVLRIPHTIDSETQADFRGVIVWMSDLAEISGQSSERRWSAETLICAGFRCVLLFFSWASYRLTKAAQPAMADLP